MFFFMYRGFDDRMEFDFYFVDMSYGFYFKTKSRPHFLWEYH
jgi:hypothetical protein